MKLNKNRVKKFFSMANVDALLIRDENVNYFIESNKDLSENWLFLKENKAVLFCSQLSPVETKAKGIEIVKLKSKKEFLSFLDKEKGKIALNFSSLTLNTKKKLRLKRPINAEKILGKLRAVKEEKEIGRIKIAQKIAERLINKVPQLIERNTTEAELKALLEFEVKRKAIDTAFEFIVASGRNSSIPHALSFNKKIRNGFLLIDLGIKWKNYCSDTSRTFFVGKATRKEREIYKKVLKLKELAEENIRPGEKAAEIFERINKEAKKILKQELKHGLGHGIGLRVHDYPVGFLADSKDVIMKGNVFTVEPAYYGKEGGVRIEDVIVVKSRKIKKLSNAPRELIEI
ncbi:MAG: aminopeptidase P family protein [Candidatus Diapherotrites archaeon]|nr:aminopeptidase P family protein [Candidatus Diapherotrites archaeon]